MKKLLLFVVIAGGLSALTACKKDHTCTCTGTILGLSYSADTTFADMTKKDAESACNGLDWTLGTDSQDCELN